MENRIRMNIVLMLLAQYKYDLSEWLSSHDDVEQVFIPRIKGIGKEKKLSSDVNVIDLDKLMKTSYRDEFLNEDIEPLETKFINSAMKYESMFVLLDSHRFAYPIGSIDEGKRNYLFYLRYWNNFINKNRIEAIVFDDVPHWPAIYALYVTALIKNVRTFIMAPIGLHIPEMKGTIHVYGESIETLGVDVQKKYDEIKETEDISLELSGIVKKYYDNSYKRTNEATISGKNRINNKKRVQVEKFNTPSGRFAELKAFTHNIKFLGGSILKNHSLERYFWNKYGRNEIRDMKKLRLFYKYDVVSLEEYDKKAVYPDYNEKYIVFPLQVWPEATTAPLAGEYSEQYNSIQLLSYITKPYNIKVYVKEYYIQPFRERIFWEELEKLENVVFIKSDVTSGDLMSNSLAVANQTGTCLMEAPFYGKPSLAFGEGYCFKGMPGLFEVKDAVQGKRIIEGILEGIQITQQDVKKYFYALQENSLFYHRTSLWEVDEESEEYFNTVGDLKKLLEEKILSKMV